MFKEILLVDIARVSNTRSYFDEDTLKELSLSISQHGVIQPIIVRPSKKGDKHKFELVAGERRYRASMLANCETIPANIRNLTDEQVLEIQITENLHRDNVNPLDEAIAFAMMQEKKNYTIEEIAARVGKTPGFVKSRLVLNDLVEDAKQLLYNGTLPVTHATKIAVLQPKKQKEAINKVIVFDSERKAIAHKPISELNFWLRQSLIKELDMAAFDITKDNLIEGVGSCLSCQKCTLNVATLFPEDATNRSCLDPACYSQKLAAHIENRIEDIKSKNKGVEPVKVSDVYYSSDPELINATNYQVRTKAEKCSSCKLGVIANSANGQEGKEVYVCQHSVCPTYKIANEHATATPEEVKRDIVNKHAQTLNNELVMQQLHDQEFDSKLMLTIEYYQKWQSLSIARQQHVVNTLHWKYDANDEVANFGILTDMEICNSEEMFMQNFHGKEQEKTIIDFEYRVYLLIYYNTVEEEKNEVVNDLLAATLVPVSRMLEKKNAKTAQKLAEFYAEPKEKALKKIDPNHLIMLFRSINALQALAKRFGIKYSENHVEPLELAKEIIGNV